MRTLKFIIEEQIIKPDPNCDFTGLVPGTGGYLQAEFSFSHEWNGCVKAAVFSSALGIEYGTYILVDGKTCMIPSNALKNRVFKVKVIGERDNFRLTTGTITVHQDGGKNND